MSTGQLIVWLRRGGNATHREVGGKAFGLQQLAGFGLPTPLAFALTITAQQSYMAGAGYDGHLPELLRRLPDPDAREQLEAAAFAAEWSSTLSAPVARAVERITELSGTNMLAVRSSAVDEDGAQRSFAGQHDTVLGVLPDGVEAAVRICWASLWSQRAIAYRTAHQMPFPVSQMGVVVQALVNARSSAIAFSLDPVSGRRDRVMITVTHGLGEPIVSGTVNPDTAVLEKRSLELISYQEGDKSICMLPRAAGGVIRVPTHNDGRAADLRSLQELATLVVTAERHLGIPVDIEAACDEQGWRLVQLRPALITAPSTASQDPPPQAGSTVGQHAGLVEL